MYSLKYKVTTSTCDSEDLLVPTIYKNGETIIVALSIGEDVSAIIEFCA